MKRLYLLLALSFFCFSPAHAEEIRYAPDDCDFQVIFPEQPYQTQRCDPDNLSHCTPVTSYTKVVDMDATIAISVTCTPVEDDLYDSYNSAVMQATLDGMARTLNLGNEETYFYEHDTAKQALLLATGYSGASAMIYTTHLWVSHNSIMSVKAQLIGDAPSPEAHEQFASILRTIGVKQEEAGEKPKDE